MHALARVVVLAAMVVAGPFRYALPQGPKIDLTGMWELTVDAPQNTMLFRAAFKQAAGMLQWPHSGFHVHDTVWVPADDRPFARRLARYCARNPVALER